MSNIKVLSDNIINKIAAGEVVERPSSVVKELVENSIDSGAKNISVEIKGGGISYIRISDDGCGIKYDEVETAFLRHATSKISNEEDLSKISSLGFRGEALASIACVSKVEMITRTKDEEFGCIIKMDGGAVTDKNETGSPCGTIITVCNLFYNTPARLKFLKTESRETIYITNIMENMALSHPEIAFKYKNNDKFIFNTNGDNNLKSVIMSLFGRNTASNVLEINSSGALIGMHGYIGNSKIARGSRSLQSLFINGRYIKSRTVNAAIEAAYKSMITINKFPVYFIHLVVNPEFIDVNVHPSKMEIKFQDEQEVFRAVYKCIRESITASDYVPDYSEEHEDKSIFKPNVETKSINAVQNYMKEVKDYDNTAADKIPDNINATNNDTYIHTSEKIADSEVAHESSENFEICKIEPLSIVGQVHFTYIVAEGENEVYLIDQHAAHERVFYEKYMNDYEKSEIRSQILLAPIVVNMSAGQIENVMDNKESFKKIGFDIEEFGDDSLIIRSVPLLYGNPDYKKMFFEIVDESELDKGNLLNCINKVIYTMACKSAVKAGDKLNYKEMTELIEKLRHCKNPFTCPHGRPTIIKTSYIDLEKKFKRIV